MIPEQGNGAPKLGTGFQPTKLVINKLLKIILISLPPIFSFLLIILGSVGGFVVPRDSFFRLVLAFASQIGFLILTLWFIGLFIFIIIPLVRKQQIIEEWSLLIQDGQQHGVDIVEKTRELMVRSKAPNITLEEKEVTPGIIRRLFGESRPFLVISNSTNANLVTYKMYLNARDYGNNLQVSWYVIHWPSYSEAMFKLTLFVPFLNLLVLPIYILLRLPKAHNAGLLDMDFFDMQDLKAYVTNTHHCVLESVDKLLLDLSQDPSKIERKSRGFLGIT